MAGTISGSQPFSSLQSLKPDEQRAPSTTAKQTQSPESHSKTPLHHSSLYSSIRPRWAKLTDSFKTTQTKTKEIKNVSSQTQQKAMIDFAAQSLHAAFSQDDDRYKTVSSTRDVVQERAYSEEATEKIVVRYALKRNFPIFGKKEYEPIGTGSLVKLDSPPMPQYGEGWLADLYVEEKHREQGHGGALIGTINDLADKSGIVGGVKLYAEQQNAAFYEKRDFHPIGKENIENQDVPGETIPVTVFSSQKPQK